MSFGINPITHPAERPNSGIGYVVLSTIQTRKEYINSCFKNNTVAIVTSNNELIKNCFVDHTLWNNIQFPEKSNQRGTCVVWIDIPSYNKPVIIGVMRKKDEFNDVNVENSFHYVRNNQYKKTSASIYGNGDKGSLMITTDGDEEGESNIYLRILNAVGKGLLDVLIQGDIKMFCEGDVLLKIKNQLDLLFVDEENSNSKTKISYILGEGFLYQDEFDNVITFNSNGGKVNLKKNKKLIIQGGNEKTYPVVLYNQMESAIDQLEKLLKDMSTTFSAASVGSTFVKTAPVLAKTTVWSSIASQIGSQFKKSKSKNFETS